jgi:hypothetical protein
LIFPNVPDDFCPTGNWTEIFQQFIDIVLANGTIDIPGLGDVTPAEIENINTELTNLQNQVDALEETTLYTGTWTPVSSGDQTFSVVFPTAFPDSDYAISLTPEIPIAGISDSNAPAIVIGIEAGSKTASGFKISIQNNQALTNTIATIHWSAIRSIT